ncbi:MAG: proline--tRNA ligase [Chrysiogenetes bacterium]|nr:proline--tRNA ligase [Chrysiogenetes bacterium]
MAKQPQNAISPTRAEDYPEWYQQVIKAADLAENSPVRGCMVIKPWGYGLWENIQRVLDRRFKETGHENAYFPLFIPKSFLEKEAEHVEGFAKECAVVTHHRLEAGPDGGLVPAGELEEPLIVRPTSETVIGAMFSKWTDSYRDLPILINQWANVVRWEMRTRLFLRTTEFLWQEGHTAHATEAEAREETRKMLDVYAEFAENYMAMPVIKGEKTAGERFPGAVNTYSIEALMQDGKALQAGTSHFLGQNFAKAQEIKYLSAEGQHEFAWTTSWGVSTRLIGGLVMSHADDDGMVMPPKLAPAHAVVLPIYRDDSERAKVLEFCDKLESGLRGKLFDGQPIVVKRDDRDLRGGEKAWQHIKKGVPLRLEVGPRDVDSGSVFLGRRDLGVKEKKGVPLAEFVESAAGILEEMQDNLLSRARAFREERTQEVASLDELRDYFGQESPGFAVAYASENDKQYEDVLAEFKVTPRCVPLENNDERGPCIFTGEQGVKKIVFARAY